MNQMFFKILALLLLSCLCFGQQYKIQGKVSTKYQNVKYCKITFINQSDTSKKHTAYSDINGEYKINIQTSVNNPKTEKPETIELKQNYPNPFSENTSISYYTPKSETIRIRIYNILGQLVKNITEERVQGGINQVIWDGCNDFGKKVSPGVYFYQIYSKNYSGTKKMIYMMPGQYSYSGTGIIFPDLNVKKSILTENNSQTYKVEIRNTDSIQPVIIEQNLDNIEINGDISRDFTIESTWEKVGPIIFTSDKGGSLQLYTMDITGTQIFQLTNYKNFDVKYCGWAPNGDMISITSDSGCGYLFGSAIYILNRSDIKKRISKAGSTDNPPLVWSADSKKIAFWWCPGDFDIKQLAGFINTDGTDFKEISPISGYFYYPLDWTKDSKALLCRINISSLGLDGNTSTSSKLSLFDLYGKEIRKWENTGKSFISAKYSSLGDKIYYLERDSLSKNDSLYVMDTNGTNIKNIKIDLMNECPFYSFTLNDSLLFLKNNFKQNNAYYTRLILLKLNGSPLFDRTFPFRISCIDLKKQNYQ